MKKGVTYVFCRHQVAAEDKLNVDFTRELTAQAIEDSIKGGSFIKKHVDTTKAKVFCSPAPRCTKSADGYFPKQNQISIPYMYAGIMIDLVEFGGRLYDECGDSSRNYLNHDETEKSVETARVSARIISELITEEDEVIGVVGHGGPFITVIGSGLTMDSNLLDYDFPKGGILIWRDGEVIAKNWEMVNEKPVLLQF